MQKIVIILKKLRYTHKKFEFSVPFLEDYLQLRDTRTYYRNLLTSLILKNCRGHFQHDGATAHIAQTSLNFLGHLNDDRLISSHTDHVYPHHLM